MLKILKIVLSIFVFLSICGCTSHSEKIVTRIDMKSSGHQQQLVEYDSPYTLAYKNNDDTYSLYIFAAPVQYWDNSCYTLIDTALTKSNIKGYLYKNQKGDIKTYFPSTLNESFLVESSTSSFKFKVIQDVSDFKKGKRKTYTTSLGDKVDAVEYSGIDYDYIFYATRAGIQLEVVFRSNPRDILFEVDTDYNLVDNLNGYIVLEDQGNKVGILYQPLITLTKGEEVQIQTQTGLRAYKKERGMVVTFSCTADSIATEESDFQTIMNTSFELTKEKLPDSCVCSKRSENAYLQRYAVVGTDPDCGEGWHYVRSRFRYFSETIKPSTILSCTYNTYLLSPIQEDMDSISAYKMNDQWSSTGMVWNNRCLDVGVRLSIGVRQDKRLSFDMTELAKNSVKDLEMLTESTGFLLKKEEDAFPDIIATSENSEYIPYFRLDLTMLPYDFTIRENINPQNGVL